MDREALIAAEPVLADLDRYLRTKHPAMPTLAKVRQLIAQLKGEQS